jgi:hypothetical protein
MDKARARVMADKVLDLLVLIADYEQLYEKGIPTIKSPEEAWALHQRIFDKQREIAGLLDQDALDLQNVNLRKRRIFASTGYMWTSLAVDLMETTCNLIISCTNAEGEKLKSTYQKLVKDTQNIIAQMLDPKAVRERIQE